MSVIKKFSCAILIIILFAGVAFAEDVKVGVLTQLNMNENDYRNFVLEGRETVGFNFLSHSDEQFVYYDSLMALQMALNAGEIQEVQLPEVVAEYFVNSNPDLYKVSCVSQVRPTYLAFGFLKKNTAVKEKIDSALKSLKEDGTLEKLRLDFIENFRENNVQKIKFEKFNDAEKIKVAITGDLPPIDFTAIDGTPTGFSVAMLAEIGKKLKVNIEIFDIDANARSSALASGRADAVFWYKRTRNYENQPDIPENVILSEPYYEWDKFLHIKKSQVKK